MARRELRGADLLRDARARPRRGRAVARRPEAPAGPRVADRVQGGVPDGARGLPAARATHERRGGRGVLPGLRPARARTATASGTAASEAPARHRRRAGRRPRASVAAQVTLADGTETELDHGHVVIAAITSCTNTSNPSVMLGAGLLAKNAVERGLQVEAVGEDVARAGLEGRHGVLRARRPDRVPRGARLPPRRLRLHDVHRQLRPAAGGDLRRRQRRGPRGRVGALAATATSRAASTPT